MCGIAGVLNYEGGVDEEVLRGMRELLVHRGPDDSGLYVNRGIGLAFRRLSIIDLVTGHQPLTNESKSVWVVFNGEIYNYRELRNVLIARGHRFETASDTECIVHGYEEWGERVFEHLNGMFAIGLWDEDRQQLVLARDRAGEKPLYYWSEGPELVFASELKALIRHPRVGRNIDWQAFDQYCSFGFVSAPRSMFEQVSKVPAAHYLVFTRAGIRLEPYWRLDPHRRFVGTYGDAKGECLRLLDEATRLRMVSDVPLGAVLSGGVDSSAVVACMTRHSALPVKTFSIGFDRADHDETSFAQLVAAHHGTENTKLVVTPAYADILERILLNFDEPFADSSALPTYLVSALTREHVTVALSGDGGDEVFGGYPTYRVMLRLTQLGDRVPIAIRQNLARLSRLFPIGSLLQRRLKLIGMTQNQRFIRLISLTKPEEKEVLYQSGTTKAIADIEEMTRDRVRDMDQDGSDYANRMQLVDFMRYLADDILVKVDRTSMLVSLETRAPFLDYRLVEFAFSLPGYWKVSPTRSKIILKDALLGHVPNAVLTRGKMGFSVPLREWIAGDLFEFCRERILSPQMKAVFEERTLHRWLTEHRQYRRDHSPKLWLLLCLSLWMARHGIT